MLQKLSIVIPCYNDEKYVLEALDSALNQSYENKEVIIVNDGSNVSTTKLLNGIDNALVKIIHQENKGLSSARNTGIKEALGEYIMLLDSDDKFEYSFAEKAIVVLNKNLHIGAVTCWGKRFIDDKIINTFKPRGGGIDDFLFQNSSIGTSMLRKSCWEEIGGYDEKMKKGYEDWEFYIRLTQKWKIHVLKEYLFYYRQRDNSMRINAIDNYDVPIKKYIYTKHKSLYIENYNELVDYFLAENQRNKLEAKNQKNKVEFKIGYFCLKPFRFVKKFLNGGK